MAAKKRAAAKRLTRAKRGATKKVRERAPRSMAKIVYNHNETLLCEADAVQV